MQNLMQAHSPPQDPAGANGALLLPPSMTVNVHECHIPKTLNNASDASLPHPHPACLLIACLRPSMSGQQTSSL